MTNSPSPQTFSGNLAVDDRGIVRFVNDFSFTNVKRFYQLENFSFNTIRAFHGHQKEAKYVYVTSGSILLCIVPMDDTKKPSKKNQVQRFVLSAHKPSILYIPPQYANGFKVLEPNTQVMFFSTSTLEESLKDDYRFEYDYWGTEVWETVNR